MYTISVIVFTYLGPSNGFTSRFLGFSLYVSNTTEKSNGILCFKDTNFTLSTIPAVFNTTCLVHGQYVIYYNERLAGVTYPDGYSEYAYNELCEVEVFGNVFPHSPNVYRNSFYLILPCFFIKIVYLHTLKSQSSGYKMHINQFSFNSRVSSYCRHTV